MIINTDPKKDFVSVNLMLPGEDQQYKLVVLLVENNKTKKKTSIPGWRAGNSWDGRRYKEQEHKVVAWRFKEGDN